MNQSVRRPQPSTKQPGGTVDIYLWFGAESAPGLTLRPGTHAGAGERDRGEPEAREQCGHHGNQAAKLKPAHGFPFLTPYHGVRSRPDLDYSIVGGCLGVSSIRKSHTDGPVGPGPMAGAKFVACAHSRRVAAVYTPA